MAILLRDSHFVFNAHSISTLTTSAPYENIATSCIGVGGNIKTIIDGMEKMDS